METQDIKKIYSSIDDFMIPVTGDIDFHKKVSQNLGKSKLERAVITGGFCALKYLAYSGVTYMLYKMFDSMYGWPAGADILKGV